MQLLALNPAAISRTPPQALDPSSSSSSSLLSSAQVIFDFSPPPNFLSVLCSSHACLLYLLILSISLIRFFFFWQSLSSQRAFGLVARSRRGLSRSLSSRQLFRRSKGQNLYLR